jgi:hypothetical protein
MGHSTMICTWQRYHDACTAARLSRSPELTRSWQHTANKMLETLLDNQVEIEAAEGPRDPKARDLWEAAGGQKPWGKNHYLDHRTVEWEQARKRKSKRASW